MLSKRTKEILDTLTESKEKGFTVASVDESFFFYDSLVRRVWIYKDNRPVVRITGSHKHTCLFGAIDLNGKQLFRQYDRFNEDTFYDYLKQIQKFPKCYLFLDKAAPRYKSENVKKYFDQHKDSLIPVWLPTASPKFMVFEECWNISKCDLLILAYYSSFTDFKKRVSKYIRTKRFKLNILHYLMWIVS
jgi:hypothetical protein